MAFWIEFEGREPACVDGSDREGAMKLAADLTGKKAVAAHNLPYPAWPRLTAGACPAFCTQPKKCKGKTSCPKSYACCE